MAKKKRIDKYVKITYHIRVELHNVRKVIHKLPKYVVDKLLAWALTVETYGLEEVRKTPGYHDEPLKGKRRGQRSIRLTKSYRLIYLDRIENGLRTIEVIEVNKHDY